MQSLPEQLDRYMRRYDNDETYSGSLLVACHEDILLSKGYGLANRETITSLSPQTKFRLASLSKQFTAALVLKLVEQGQMSTKAPIGTYLPDYPRGDRITIHHLLTHSAGLGDPIGLDETHHYPRVADLVGLFREQPQLSEPGECFRYNYSSYVLLTHLIEIVTGSAFEDALRTYLLKPAGLTNTGYDLPERIVMHRASGYYVHEDRVVNGKYNNMTAYAGAAGLYSTTEDLFRWSRALLNGEILRPDLVSQLFTRHQGTYGYGWHVDEAVFGDRRKSRVHHGGLNDGGFASEMAIYPDDGVCIISLTNFLLSPQEKIMHDLASVVFGAPYQDPRPRPAILENVETDHEAYAGTYEGLLPVEISSGGDRLYLHLFGFKLALFASRLERDYSIFSCPKVHLDILFRRNESGVVSDARVLWLGDEGFACTKKSVAP